MKKEILFHLKNAIAFALRTIGRVQIIEENDSNFTIKIKGRKFNLNIREVR